MIQPLSAALALGLSFSVLSGAAAAELKARPGLWENQVSVRSGDAQLDQLAADAQALWHELTPELREMVEETMSARGLSLRSVPAAPRVCITAQQAARDELPAQSEQCTPLQTAREGNKVKVKFHCDPELAAAGEGELALLSPTRYEGTTRIDSAVSGQPQRVTLVVEGRWLAPSCRPAGFASR